MYILIQYYTVKFDLLNFDVVGCSGWHCRQRRMSNLRLPDQPPKGSISQTPSPSPSPSAIVGTPSGPSGAPSVVPSGSLRPSVSSAPGDAVEVDQIDSIDPASPASPSSTSQRKSGGLLEPPPIGTPGPPGEHSQSVLMTPVQTGPQPSRSEAPSRRTSNVGVPKISVESDSIQPRTRWQYIKEEAVPTCRQINRSKAFLLIMFVALLFALFFPDLWILVDRPTNVDLDVLLTLVFLMFVFEFVVQCIAGRHTYVGSFFFYMDILGGVSLLLDLNYIGIQALIQSAGDVGNQAGDRHVATATIAYYSHID